MIRHLRTHWHSASVSLQAALQQLRTSRLARHAAASMFLMIFSRIAGFFAMTYAARCLGPESFGISGTIYLSAAYFALLANFGFDAVSVRQIAVQKHNVHQIAKPLLSFRALVLLGLSLVWGSVCWFVVPSDQRWLWLLGIAFLWTQGLNFLFVFQGLEEIGWHYATLALQSGLSALLIFLFFSPGMPVGSDLVVTVLAGLVSTLTAAYLYYRKTQHCPIGRFSFAEVATTFRESWRYWLLTTVNFTVVNAQVPLLALMADAHAVGIYRSGYAMAMALDLFFSSVYSLFLPRLSIWQAIGKDTFQKKLTATFWLCVALGGSLTTIVCLSAPMIYKLLLGDAFLTGVAVLQVLAITRFIAFIAQPYWHALIALQQGSATLQIGIFSNALYVLLAISTVPSCGPLAMALSALAADSTTMALSYWFVKRKLEQSTVLSEDAATHRLARQDDNATDKAV
ncbi:MAG: oligosaccharide flippase family protein [Chloroherpetonaceae bacterium]|nr:oligosaccharide flippase family protein [Chloroherpetonaceae bacterium]MCS7211490.1 oligosaccharide flippase family protein [Chloroherpetonaceae bacterium]MDW8018922.1 oligosaccharide flippase family protein [Chloroherpetonaceae bacterium]